LFFEGSIVNCSLLMSVALGQKVKSPVVAALSSLSASIVMGVSSSSV